MQISLKWINELVDIKTLSLNSLIEKLTLGGFEVEEILEVKSDHKKEIVLEISTTANRSDSLSIQGISKEINALLNKNLKLSPYLLKKFSWQQQIENSSKLFSYSENCSTFVAVSLTDLTNLTVPKWMEEKLVQSGLNLSNNLLDFQNYILLETGYPFAFYDYDKICSKLDSNNLHFSISHAGNKTTFNAANGSNYQLDESILLVKVNDIPISLGGIIESDEFSYSENTRSLIVEASIFDAAIIRQQSRKLGLRTDRSARYEKSLKNTYLNESLYRLVLLIKVLNPDLICQFQTILQTEKKEEKPIILKYQTIKEILGPVKDLHQTEKTYISTEQITSYLNRLDFQFSYHETKLLWEVKIPHSRSDDLLREIDLVEEIGRLHGFNNFLTTLPKIKTIGNEDSTYKIRKKITTCLLNLGLNELIHYSLTPSKKFLTNEVLLLNPLVSDYSHLRSSLLPDLIITVEKNLKQGNLFIEGFEYGHIFLNDSKKLFQERESVAGIFGGIMTKLNWSNSPSPLTWFEAKGKIEILFQQLNLSHSWSIGEDSLLDSDSTIFHPFRKADLYLPTKIKFGSFGQIHPVLAKRLNISLSTYLFEFDLELIRSQVQKNQLMVYEQYSTYPKIIKDLSFRISRKISFYKLQDILYKNGTKFLQKINLLDEYRADSIPVDETSLCLELVFQSDKKTLQNKEIELVVQDLQRLLTKKFGATMR